MLMSRGSKRVDACCRCPSYMLLFFGMLLVPDTPNSLAERGRPDQARRVLERIRGTSQVDAEMKSIVAAVEKGNKVANLIL